MTDTISSPGFISDNSRSQNDFPFLLTQCVSLGHLHPAALSCIQEECLVLLAQQARRFTGGQSSSLQIERMQALMDSIYYTLNVALKEFPDCESALSFLKQHSVSQLYEMGQNRIRRKLQATRTQHQILGKHLLDTPNVFYNATIREGIPGFFRFYRPEFFAHETHITADYPVYLPPKALSGIEFIQEYLLHLSYENRFCRFFSPDTIHMFLHTLDEHYPLLLTNLFSPVLSAALCCVLSSQPIQTLSYDRPKLEILLENHSAAQTEALFSLALRQLTSDLSCPPGLCSYLQRCLPTVAVSVKQMLDTGHFHLETI
mgnify:FL=1